jgi:hypothetical protein
VRALDIRVVDLVALSTPARSRIREMRLVVIVEDPLHASVFVGFWSCVLLASVWLITRDV